MSNYGVPAMHEGERNSAILLMMLSESSTTEVLKLLEPAAVERLAHAMGLLENVKRPEIAAVLREFFKTMRDESPIGESNIGGSRIRNLLVGVLGKDKASEVISQIKVLDRRGGGLESLNRKAPSEIASLAKLQHPQVAATLIAHLDNKQSTEVIRVLPAEFQREVLLRVAGLETVSEAAVEELKQLVDQHFGEETAMPVHRVGGPKFTAALLNSLEKEEKESILQGIRDSNAELAESIHENMFTFDDLLRVDDRGIQGLLTEVPGQSLTVALKGAEEETKDKILGNMSRRAAEMLRDDLEAGGPVKLSEVEAAQKDIVSVARRMMEEGTITVEGMGGGEELIG